jgi:hypothetical protein
MTITHILIADSSVLTVVGAETLLKERADTMIRKSVMQLSLESCYISHGNLNSPM